MSDVTSLTTPATQSTPCPLPTPEACAAMFAQYDIQVQKTIFLHRKNQRPCGCADGVLLVNALGGNINKAIRRISWIDGDKTTIFDELAERYGHSPWFFRGVSSGFSFGEKPDPDYERPEYDEGLRYGLAVRQLVIPDDDMDI